MAMALEHALRTRDGWRTATVDHYADERCMSHVFVVRVDRPVLRASGARNAGKVWWETLRIEVGVGEMEMVMYGREAVIVRVAGAVLDRLAGRQRAGLGWKSSTKRELREQLGGEVVGAATKRRRVQSGPNTEGSTDAEDREVGGRRGSRGRVPRVVRSGRKGRRQEP